MSTEHLQNHLEGLLGAFDLGSQGRLSQGPVASGRFGAVWRLDTDLESWAVKQVGDLADSEFAQIIEGAAFRTPARRP